MSSSVAIPAQSTSTPKYDHQHHRGQPSKSSELSSSSSSYTSSPSTPDQTASSEDSTSDEPTPGSSSKAAEKRKVIHVRRPSLLSSAISKEECTTINIADPDGPPRLISYLSSSQGFAWNPEIFLPSYVDHEYTPLENRREPVHEIRLTDEEIKNMLPE